LIRTVKFEDTGLNRSHQQLYNLKWVEELATFFPLGGCVFSLDAVDMRCITSLQNVIRLAVRLRRIALIYGSGVVGG